MTMRSKDIARDRGARSDATRRRRKKGRRNRGRGNQDEDTGTSCCLPCAVRHRNPPLPVPAGFSILRPGRCPVQSLISKARPIAGLAVIIVCSCTGPTDLSTTGPRNGWLIFSTTIAGVDPDLNGFTASIDQKRLRAVPASGNDSVEVSAGRHEVRFSGVANNCRPTSSETPYNTWLLP